MEVEPQEDRLGNEPWAFLFCGDMGSGKSFAADLVAKKFQVDFSGEVVLNMTLSSVLHRIASMFAGIIEAPVLDKSFQESYFFEFFDGTDECIERAVGILCGTTFAAESYAHEFGRTHAQLKAAFRDGLSEFAVLKEGRYSFQENFRPANYGFFLSCLDSCVFRGKIGEDVYAIYVFQEAVRQKATALICSDVSTSAELDFFEKREGFVGLVRSAVNLVDRPVCFSTDCVPRPGIPKERLDSLAVLENRYDENFRRLINEWVWMCLSMEEVAAWMPGLLVK